MSKLDVPKSMDVLNQLLEIHTPHSLADDDCVLIGRIVAAASLIAAPY
jgi:hypothetical protein